MSECPPERIWDELATGLITGVAAERYLDHASWCEACALRLREAIEVFQPEEAAQSERIQPIPVALPESKPMPEPARPRPSRAWIPWAIAASLVASAGLGYYAWFGRATADPLAQLAVAYSKERTFELRIPGAAHGRYDATRSGGGGSLANRPEEWIAVAGRVRSQLAAQPRDPLWLHAQGRLALLDHRPDEAIAALLVARDFGAAHDDVAVDLATAYYQRAMARGDEGAADLTLAQDLLGPVIQRSATNVAARYNRALIEIELHQLPSAIADLEQVVRLETDAKWKEEARQKLEQARARMRGFLERNPAEDEARWVELLLDRLMRQPPDSANAGDWDTLAGRLQRDHRDPWARELNALPKNDANQATLARLAQLASIRLAAQRGRYLAERADADPLQRASLPPPLAAWRDFEIAYRSTHSGGAFGCIVAEIPNRYRWLSVQAKREAGSCAAPDRAGFARRLKLRQESRDTAREAGLAVSAARAEALLGVVEFLEGRYREALAHQRRLLGRMIDERLPVSRSHEPVHSMMLATRALGRPYAARSAAAMATAIARASGLRNAEFTDLANEAELAWKTGDKVHTEMAYRQAIWLFEQSQGTVAPASARAWVEVIMAEASADSKRLAPFHELLESTPDLFARVPYLRVRSHWDPPARAIQQLEQAQQLLTNIPDSRRPGFLREEAVLAAHQRINLLLAAGRAEESLRLAQDVLGWSQGAAALPRAAIGSRTLFSLRIVGPRVIVWRRDVQSIQWRDAGTADGVERSIRRLRRFASSPHTPGAEIHRASVDLTKDLFGNWLAELPQAGGILFQAEGILQAIPYSLLRGRELELAKEHSIAITSMPAPSEPARQERRPARTAVMVDATRVPGLAERGLRPLPPPEEEWAALRAYAPRVERIAGSQVTAERVAATAPAGHLHFAGHAEAAPQGAGLVLAGGKLGHFSAPAPWRVVLSACSTARLEQDEEDTVGIGSLATAFLAAGSAEVVAADWDLESRAAGILMQEFYAELTRHDDFGQALFEGVRRLAARAEFAHPYYWAGMRWLVRA